MNIPYYNDLRTIIHNTAPISEEAIDKMISETGISYTAIRKGELLYKEGELCRSVFIVREGIFRNFVYDDGRETTRWFAIGGDIFTSLMSWSRGLAASNVEAVTKAWIWTIPIHDAKLLIESSGEWRDWLLKMLIDGMGLLENRDRVFISSDAYTRFKNFYIWRPQEIVSQIPLGHLASYLRITQQTLCRCRRRLIKEIREQDKNNNKAAKK